MRMVAGERLLDFLNVQRNTGGRCGIIAHSQSPSAGMPYLWRRLSADPVAYAHDLSAAVRERDQAGSALIVVEAPPARPDWTAVAARLRRAAAGSGGA